MSAVLGDPIRHIWLVRRMAEHAGVELAEAQFRGTLSQEAWAAMVTRCRGCDAPEDCARLLERRDFPRPPDWCENRDALANLAEAERV